MVKRMLMVGVIGLGLSVALLYGTEGMRGAAKSHGARARDLVRDLEAEAARLLDDRSKPWWDNHRAPRPKGPTEYKMSPSDDLGARVDPPIYTPPMPLPLAAWIASGGRPRDGHPLAGRPFVLLDVSRRSDFLAEHIKGSVNVPGPEIESSLESGELSKLDRRAVVVAFGSRWPHFEVVSKLRGPKGFEAVYAMEGREGWKSKGYPVELDEKLAHFLKMTESERRPPGSAAPAPEDPEGLPGVDPLALKALLDAGVDMTCVFVGDRRTYEAGHVPGAIYVPVTELEKKFADADRNRLLAVQCGCCQGKRGGPSEIAVRQLNKMGFARVIHLDGHMYAWKAAGLPVELEDPRPRK